MAGQVSRATAATVSAAAPGAGSGDVVKQTAGGVAPADTSARATDTSAPATAAASRGDNSPAPVKAINADDLPFTGLDLALICAGGLLLMGIGVAARWLSSPRPQT